jgi:drug/metabolite transporter (DMT)-like permease
VTAFCGIVRPDPVLLCTDEGAREPGNTRDSAYPIVTVIGSALFLGEKITLVRGIGTGLVISASCLLSR